MADDVRIATGLRNHRKTKRLRRLLGADACWSLVCLFLWAGEERWTGDLSGLTDADIEEEAGWEGEPGALVAALVEVGFVSGDAGRRAIHDWQEHNPYAASKGSRIARGKKGAAARWSKADGDASSMQQACSEHATSNASGINKQCPPAPAPAPTPTNNPVANATGAVAPPEPDADPIWGAGLAFLIRKGVPMKQARSLLGQLRKTCGDAETCLLLMEAEAQDITSPAPWLMAAAGKRSRAGPASAPSKTLSAVETLQRMKSNGRVDPQRDFGRTEPLALPELGADPGGRHDPGHGHGMG